MQNSFKNNNRDQGNNQNKEHSENGSNIEIKDYSFKKHPRDDLDRVPNIQDRQFFNNNENVQGRDQFKMQLNNPSRGQELEHNNPRNNPLMQDQQKSNNLQKQDFKNHSICKVGEDCNNNACPFNHPIKGQLNLQQNIPQSKARNYANRGTSKDTANTSQTEKKQSKQLCYFGDKCKKQDCSYIHKKDKESQKMCRNEKNGDRENCFYQHKEEKQLNTKNRKYNNKQDNEHQENKVENIPENNQNILDMECFNKESQKIHIQQEKQNQAKDSPELLKDNDQGCFIKEMRKLQNKENSVQMVMQPEKPLDNIQIDKKKQTEVLNSPKNNQKSNNQQSEQIKIFQQDKQDDNKEGLVEGIQQKCHWFDLFGKCDENSCNFAHDFQPLFYCQNIKENKQCLELLPMYIQEHFKKNKQEAYSCNNQDQYRKRIDCHDYCLEGVCSTIICKKFHKKYEKKCPNVGDCPDCQKRTSIIQEKIEQIEQFLTEQFQYGGKEFQKKLQGISDSILSLRQQAKSRRDTIDLLFIVDCTESMQKWIDFVQEKIESIIQGFKKFYPNFQQRYSFVGYRDFDDKRDDEFNFSSDLAKFKEHIKKIKATGGGDFAEDMVTGLKTFLFYDAPTHGKNYHDGDITDDYLDIKVKIEDYIQMFIKQNIYFTQIMLKKPNDKKYYAQKTFNAIKNEYIRNGKEKYIFELLTSQDPNQSVENFIVSVLRSSVDHTLSNNFGNKGPSWNKENPAIKNLKFNQNISFNFRNQFIRQDIPTKWEDPFIIEETSFNDYTIQVQELSAKGSSRIAFNGEDILLQKKIVIKFDQQITENPVQNLQHMKCLIKSQIISSHLVQIFRKNVLPFVQSLESLPYYISSKIAKFGDNYCYIESFLEGFDKFSNNADFQKEVKSENQLLLECLPHFTFQYTQGYLMLCDLQGSGPILTDPCIHTFNREGYGQTNLGMQGMAFYFMKHQCNKFCFDLNLVHPEQSKNLGDDYDYCKEITNKVKDKLLCFKNQNTISKYKERTLFCQLCEDKERKNTNKQMNLQEFVESICVECEISAKQMTNSYCTMCGAKFKFSEYELIRSRGHKNGRCQVCNKYSDLMNLFNYHNIYGEFDRFEIPFRVFTNF